VKGSDDAIHFVCFFFDKVFILFVISMFFGWLLTCNNGQHRLLFLIIHECIPNYMNGHKIVWDYKLLKNSIVWMKTVIIFKCISRIKP
jgi:hypothetical protein